MSDQPEQPPSEADHRMAELLAEDEASRKRHRRRLQKEQSPVSDDVLERLNVLDFVNSVVGEATDVPEILGDYRVTGLLGRGGMGTVYQAYQESLERDVALKVLSPAYSADPKMRKRFRSEARATASLHHQHIVPIYDYGEAGGCLYFAMERVDGISLDKQISAARHRGEPLMKPREAARRFAGVADALGHAHKRRLLHRDVKPGNILVQPDGAMALADFGLSKVLGEASMHLTGTGEGFLGTLHYAAPEQARVQELTPASDLYSLGVTMFEAITGKLPVTGETAEQVLQSILHGTPLRLRDCMHRAPKDLEAILDKLLSKEPEDRYDDGEALARDLMRVAEGEPVRIRRQPLALRLWRRARKNPGLSAAVVTVLVLLLVTAALLQGIQNVETQSRESRHGDLLAQAMTAVKFEAGPASGPSGLLAGITGIDEVEAAGESSMIPLLRDAQGILPDDMRASDMEAAYRGDPQPEATALLREGRGHEALQRLDRAIGDRTRRGNASSEIELYRLYVARAVANLTRAVSRVDLARMDLVRATLLRPGAFFASVLMAVTEWEPGTGADSLVQQLDRLLDDSEFGGTPSGGDTVVGHLLLTLADVRPLPRANLMEFPISYGERRVLHLRAVELLGGLPDESVSRGSSTGLEARLAEHARAALQNIGDSTLLDHAVDEGTAILAQSVGDDSPLNAWRLVFAFLKKPDSQSAILLRSGISMSPSLQVRGWLALFGLEPSEDLVGRARDRVRELRGAYAEMVGLNQLDALLHRWVGSATEAFETAQKWVQEEPDNPDALLCRLEARLLNREDMISVSSDGTIALGAAADWDAVLRSIVEMLMAAEKLYAADQEQLEELRRTVSQFRSSSS